MDARVADHRKERRRTRRHRTVEAHGISRVRVRPGHDAAVLDVSADGVLVETAYRLLPGSSVDLQIEAFTHRVAVRGRVLRCAVAAVRPWSVLYRAAILFEGALRWLVDPDENIVPTANEAVRVSTTHRLR